MWYNLGQKIPKTLDDSSMEQVIRKPTWKDALLDLLLANILDVDLLFHQDPYKFMSPDGINSRIPKEPTDVITKPLLMIFEQYWESREVPDDWKLANVVLIFKKGQKEDPGNCSQHGFKRGKSCLSNLISFYDNVTHLADQGKPIDVICLDFSEAFNTVPHRILLDKMPSTAG
ncbi:RNA-directed DNA polymerase from mobile element jockey-like protein [Pitangus sulphuratus]|nr:RNA-directed DNA polymerase from mobile element jockey-like protein [Pitangus sulphuratus]